MGNQVSTPAASPAPVADNQPTSALLQSRRSSVSSITSSDKSPSSVDQSLHAPSTLASSASSICSQVDPAYPIDPLTRQFPAPAEEVDVAEMLKRKPLKWSLGHYIASPTRDLEDPFDHREKVAQDMEAKKGELLAAKEEMRKLAQWS